MSQACAREMSPSVLLKLRFSGLAVTEECAQKAHQLSPANQSVDASVGCEMDWTKKMALQLQRQNVTGAVSMAEAGLRRCRKIDSPCDFQLAPVLVTSLARVFEHQQMEAALEGGLQQAVEFQANLLRSPRRITGPMVVKRHAEAAPAHLSQPSQP